MRAFIAATLFLVALIASAAIYFDVPYWLLPPEQKFAQAWRDDIALLEKTKSMPEAWNDLAEVSFSTNEGFVEEWYKNTQSPFVTSPKGKFKLQILALHQINGTRYGVMLQYNWIEIESGNTVGELGRTLPLGFIY